MKNLIYMMFGTICFSAICLFAQAAEGNAPATLTVGAASEEITPETPVMMGGYASRSKPHEGVRSPIFTRVLYCAKGAEQILWTESDLIGFEAEDAAKIRQTLSDATNVPAERVIVSTTHTHSAPAAAPICSPKESDYLENFLIPRMVIAAKKAIQTAEDCTMTVVEGESHLAHDRRNDPAPGDGAAPNADKAKAVVDYRVPAVGFQKADGSFKAVLIQYAMHPTSWSDQLIGAEWPGETAIAIRETFGDNVEPFVVQGAAGNLSSPSRKAPPEEMRRWGRELVATVAEKLQTAKPLETAPFAAASSAFFCDYDRFDAETIRAKAEEYRKQFAGRPDIIEFTINPWEKNTLDALENGTMQNQEIFVQAVLFGDHIFVTTPFETFSHLNNLLAERCGFPVHVVGYTNGVYNYFPTKEAFEQGGYEPNSYLWYRSFPMKPGALEKLAEDLAPILSKLKIRVPSGAKVKIENLLFRQKNLDIARSGNVPFHPFVAPAPLG